MATTTVERPHNEAAISGVVKALEFAWEKVYSFHPDELPRSVAISVGTRGRKLVNGYHQAQRWHVTDGFAGEVFIAAEGLSRSATAVFTTLLHEAAHAVAAAKGVKDTSQSGRYHNAKYAQIGRSMGLIVQLGEHGYDTVGLTDETVTRYAAQIRQIKAATQTWRVGDPVTVRGPNKNLLKAVCECEQDNSIRTSRRRVEKGLVCPVCAAYFVAVEPPPVSEEPDDDD